MIKLFVQAMAVMLFIGAVVAVFALIAAAVLAAALLALLWVSLAAAHDRRVSRGSGIGYWRWWGDRFCELGAASDERGARDWMTPELRRRRIVRLEHQLRNGASAQGPSSRGQKGRLAFLQARLDREREALYGPLAPPKPHQRVADSDRELTIAALTSAHGEGRLDNAELETRVGRAYAAKTYAQLDALCADLPAGRKGPAPAGRSVRVSTPDRERAVSLLAAAFEEGRLSEEELEDRTARASAARFERDLEALLDDIPDSYARRRSQLRSAA